MCEGERTLVGKWSLAQEMQEKSLLRSLRVRSTLRKIKSSASLQLS